jgi:hypothetical protein
VISTPLPIEPNVYARGVFRSSSIRFVFTLGGLRLGVGGALRIEHVENAYAERGGENRGGIHINRVFAGFVARDHRLAFADLFAEIFLCEFQRNACVTKVGAWCRFGGHRSALCV